MPRPDFFGSLGFFVQRGFLDLATCAQIKAEMSAAQSQKALVAKKDVDDGVLDEDTRTVLTVDLAGVARTEIKDRIWGARAALENHFGVRLGGGHGPIFLRYEAGAFYKPHKDSGPDAHPALVARKISIVIFLNPSSLEPTENCYGGGALTFYGLLEGPEWEKCAFPLEAEPGLLIAFPSETLHEVQPVTFGKRFTIVAWLTS